ncbi:MAG: fatty acid cis/trans isomerase [Nibricoccus sp.]
MLKIRSALFAVVLAGCTTLAQDSLDQRYGQPDPSRFDVPPAVPAGGMSYRTDVQPILERRCVVCHACYDAPCQLKLGPWEGIARGASKAQVYDAGRLVAAQPTRLFVDAQLPSQWRTLGFFPVLNERTQTPEANLAASVLHRSLALKRAHPLPGDAVLSAPFDFSTGRAQSCARLDQFASYERDFPLAGMPYGLPGLNDKEFATVTRWLQQGAGYDGPLPLSAGVTQQIQVWETFLNGDSPKAKLMSRYLYEHLFLAHLYFESDPAHRPLKLVRSGTAPGQPVALIATRRPYDDPGVPRVYYRIVAEQEAIVAKSHMPYALSPERMAKFRGWFLDAEYDVGAEPSYAIEVASNPFVAFHALPPESRYRFLLDEAQFFIMTFIKGPVCRGQIAVNVIDDRFWVFFSDPKVGAGDTIEELLVAEANNLQLPSERGSDASPLAVWLQYAGLETRFLQAKSRALDQMLGGSSMKDDLTLIWDGDGRNANAALTVFRNFDNASVVKGLVGEHPKTAWVISYPLFERIYYLLVAGYDVYGNVGHQLNTRLYMDFLRMEGEFNFLVLLPEAARQPTAEYWYRGAPREVKDFVYGRNAYFDHESGIQYHTEHPQRELYDMLQVRLTPVLDTRFDLAGVTDDALRRDLQALSGVQGASTAWLPEAVVMRVESGTSPAQYFSLLKNTAHRNVAHAIREKEEFIPAENTLTVTRGFIGAYPNAIFDVRREDLPALTTAIGGLSSESDYRRLADRFAIRRTNPAFWNTSDAMLDAYFQWAPLEAGLLDYNRLENR